MPLRRRSEIRARAPVSVEQRFDIRLHVEEIDLRRFGAPLLRQQRSLRRRRRSLRSPRRRAAEATADFEQTHAMLLATLIARRAACNKPGQSDTRITPRSAEIGFASANARLREQQRLRMPGP